MDSKRLIIDIETLGIKPDAVVVQVTAVLWDDGSEDHVVTKQTWNLDVPSQQHVGRSIDYDTVLWWRNQSADAFNSVFSEDSLRIPILAFRIQFKQFMEVVAKYYGSTDIEVWANSPSFDLVILQSLANTEIFKYRNWRDQRTLEAMYKLVLHKNPKTNLAQACDDYAAKRSNGGLPHTAEYDALWQGKFISLMVKELSFAKQGELL